MSNDEFAAALPGFLTVLHRRVKIRLTSLIAQLVVTALLCGLICCGIMRHKNGFVEMDSASEFGIRGTVSKTTFEPRYLTDSQYPRLYSCAERVSSQW